MATKWLGSTILVLCCCLLATGCASRIQKSLDRSVLIAKRCADIEEAVHSRQGVENELVNAIALRLVATCTDGSQSCLGFVLGMTPPSAVISAGKLLEDLEKYQTALGSLNQNFLQTNRNQVDGLKKSQEDLRNALTQRRNNTVAALDELYKRLAEARTVLGDSLSQASACDRRTSCVAMLGRELSTVRLTLTSSVRNLQQKLQDLRALAWKAQILADNTTAFLDGFNNLPAGGTMAGHPVVKEATEKLKRSTVDLVSSSTFLAERLETGSRAIDSLFSAEVQVAATDLFAARLYERVADKTIVAIDRLLSQVDRTIDKVDEHAYGAATLGTYLFEDEIQDKFDRIFTTHVAERLPENSRTAKLAFAAAACKRLVPDDNSEAGNSSLFSSFVYAALIRMQVDLEGGKHSAENVRREWEQSLNRSESQSTVAGQKSDAAFLGLVAEAYRTDSALSSGVQRAPSILQQVALCAGVEQQLASARKLSPADLKERSWAACGKAAMSATLMGHGMPDALSPVLVTQTIEKAEPVPFALVPDGETGPGDPAAWRRAMEAVLAASIPKPPSGAERLCQRIRHVVTATRCEPNAAGTTVTLDFDTSFTTGRAGSRILEMKIARLADMLGADGQTYAFTVYGYASASDFFCVRPAARNPSPCGTGKNHALATARAEWALSVLRKRMRARVAADSQAVGLFNPLSFDTPADRRIRMAISLVSPSTALQMD